MRRIETFTIYENPDPLLVSRQALFPGLLQLPDGELIALFTIGQAFDSADMRTYVSRSVDDAHSWSAPRRLHEHESVPEESESFKAVRLSDGRLLATGYAFVRPDPLGPIVHPLTLELPRLVDKVSVSSDNGHTWTVPEVIDIEGAPLELSGPATELPSGRIIAATSPFHLRPDGHAGWIVASDDGGRRWYKLSEFFRGPGSAIHAWECRLAAWGRDRVAVMFWAYDHARNLNLNNHIAFSSNGGESFGDAVDTGVRGQSANLLHLAGEELLTIHTHREDPVGLTVRRVDVAGGGFRVLEELELFADAAMGSSTADMHKQFGSLKFGQPSVLRLQSGEVLAACWSFENHQYVIKGFRIAL